MRAVGLVRQSRGREDSLSPAEQRERIVSLCEREGLTLLAVHEEIDVSGGSPLAEREGLRAAVEAVEGNQAEVVVVAYFDRLFRSLTVQAEVVNRVEKAGGRIMAADVGTVSEATPAQWISGTMLGVVSEYYRRSIRERSGEGQRLAVAEGRVPYDRIVPGYRREGGKLVPSEDAPVIVEAFRMRAEGATIKEVRAHLFANGITRGYSGVERLFSNRTYLGELHFGKLHNPAAHEPIIDRALWDRVQAIKVPRGARPPSDRLLARLGVLRCGTCGARMVVGFRSVVATGERYDFYRCPPTGDCERRVTISADKVEAWTVERVKEAIEGMEGRASADERVREAEVAVEQAQADLEAAIRVFGGIRDEPAAAERIGELVAVREAAVEHLDQLGSLRSAKVVGVEDWDLLSVEAQRAIIRAVIRVYVAPGRGDRLSCQLLIE